MTPESVKSLEPESKVRKALSGAKSVRPDMWGRYERVPQVPVHVYVSKSILSSACPTVKLQSESIPAGAVITGTAVSDVVEQKLSEYADTHSSLVTEADCSEKLLVSAVKAMVGVVVVTAFID